MGKRFFVIPSWLDSPCPPDRLPLLIDPGQAFGTGTHESTQLTLEAMERVVTELAALDLGLPIWAKPNAGLPTGVPPRYNTTPEDLAAYAARYIAAGARIVGGCCGTTPAHVAALARMVADIRVEDRG